MWRVIRIIVYSNQIYSLVFHSLVGTTCVSGARGCDLPRDPVCDEPSCCADVADRQLPGIPDANTCLLKCKQYQTANPPCKRYTYIPDQKLCDFYSKSTCSDAYDGPCITGQPECSPTGKIFNNNL